MSMPPCWTRLARSMIQIDIEPLNAAWTFPVDHVLLGDAGYVMDRLCQTACQSPSRPLATSGACVEPSRPVQAHDRDDTGPAGMPTRSPFRLSGSSPCWRRPSLMTP